MIELDAVQRLNKDLRAGAAQLTGNEARFLVDAYYTIQDYRKAAGNQFRALAESGEPNDVLGWLFKQHETMENQIKRALDSWTDASEVGQWAKSITGIGPVIAAGLLAHIDISRAPTVGHIWKFAGLDPTVSWGKGEKRPWNASLKVLCWKIGESFVKVSNLAADVYGKVYQQRKADEQAANEAGKLAEQARLKLANFKIGKDTDARKWYEQGKLPPAHIHARAKRYAVKLFLSHYHHVAWESEYGAPPPKPYVISQLGHAHFLAPPNWKPMIVRIP